MTQKTEANRNVQTNKGQVYGFVKVSYNAPDVDLSGLIVQAYDRGLHSEQQLGIDVTSDEKGYYSIEYGREELRRADKEHANLILRVSKKAGENLKEIEAAAERNEISTLHWKFAAKMAVWRDC